MSPKLARGCQRLRGRSRPTLPPLENAASRKGGHHSIQLVLSTGTWLRPSIQIAAHLSRSSLILTCSSRSLWRRPSFQRPGGGRPMSHGFSV
eukprot:7631315-Pyramimonas_sp.AAC.1